MSKLVTCKKCKEKYRKAESIDEDALIEKHVCPVSADDRIADLEKRVAQLERHVDRMRWRA